MTSIQDFKLDLLDGQVEELTDDIASGIQGGAGNSNLTPGSDPELFTDLFNVFEGFIEDLEPFGAIPGIVEFQESLIEFLTGVGVDIKL